MRKVYLVGLSLILLLNFVALTPVYAVEYAGVGGKPANPRADNPRTQSIFIFELEPGKSGEDAILVVNNTADTKTLLVYAADSQKSSDGSFACEQLSDSKEGVGSWIAMSKDEVVLAPHTSQKVGFTIKASDNASVGEENGCVLVQEKKVQDKDASGVSLSFRTGIRVVVTIPGEQHREIKIDSFETSVTDRGQVLNKVSVKNSGNVSVDTETKVFVTGLFNTQYANIDNTYPVLRGDTSTYNFEISKPYWGGVLYSTVEIAYDDTQSASVGVDPETPNKVASSSTNILWVWPEPIALVVELAGVAIAGWAIMRGIKKYRKRKQNLIKWQGSYKVAREDDIETIAKKFKVKWEELAKMNKLKPPYKLEPGQILKVPQ